MEYTTRRPNNPTARGCAGCAGDYGLSCVLENLTTSPPCAKAKAALEKWVSWDIDSIKVTQQGLQAWPWAAELSSADPRRHVRNHTYNWMYL